jgi:hypothetical protein
MMAETLILSFYPTNNSPSKGLRCVDMALIDKIYQLFGVKFASHEKVL